MAAEIDKKLTAVYERIERFEPKLHALLKLVATEPNSRAGSLAGMVGTIKDVIVTEGVETTAGSKMLKGWLPPYEATLVARLKLAGATLVGKTNCDAWAHGSSTENSDYGPTKNPWALDRVPGGSSGGSAAAVALGYGDFSIGTDTGGSIRQPAAFCGVTGLKPSYGRVSRVGLIAMVSSFDCPGPLARDAATCARVLEVIAGKDRFDATTAPAKPFVASRVTAAPDHPDRPLVGLRVGLPKEFFGEGLDRSVRRAVEAAIVKLEGMGATLKEIQLPSTSAALAAYYIIQPAEVSSNLARYDGIRYGHSVRRSQNHIDVVKQNRAEGFGAEAKRRIMLGTFVLSAGYVDAYYKQALRVRTLVRQEFQEAFEGVDVIATPTTPTAAFRFGEKTSDPLAMYLEDVYTVSANLVGIPGVSVPCGFVTMKNDKKENLRKSHNAQFLIPDADGVQLPVGLQLLGPMFSEELILRVAHQYQQATDWHKRQPPHFEHREEGN